MLEIAKAFIEHGLWPLCLFVLVLVFRPRISALLEREVTFKGWGTEAMFTSAAKQLDKITPGGQDPLLKPADTQTLLPLAEELEQRRNAVKNYGGDYETQQIVMKNITEQLAILNFNLESTETSEVLIRHLAATQLLLRAEVFYRLVFGSQIAALRKLDTGPQPEAVIRHFYERARNRSPRFYKDYPFESWMGFLTSNETVVYENGQYAISRLGRDFLGWLAAIGAPRKMH